MYSTIKIIGSIGILGAALCLSSCGSETTTNTTETNDSVVVVSDEISLSDVPSSPAFEDANLRLGDVTGTKMGDSVKLAFNFVVSDYQLGNQTMDANTKMCANSDKGQHIHFILDNSPYAALYEPKHEVTVEANSEHFLLCFLSRSYHESIKAKNASFVYHFKVDGNGKVTDMNLPNVPMLFYSRPKGTYVGKDTANLLLDYYVKNATLGAEYMVKAEVTNIDNGRKATFELKEWKAQFINNLGTGKCNVTLTLMDSSGNAVNSPASMISRDFTMAASEPLP